MINLSVSQKTVADVFKELKTKKFIIPAFQRPYKWDEEKCETLWNDVVEFSLGRETTDESYFLGTIVTYTTQDGNKEVIDGQQRLTSLLLLLRAFYTKLAAMTQDKEVKALKSQISPVIWAYVNSITKEPDKDKLFELHIFSEVATEESNDIFHKILETGESQSVRINRYSENYDFFYDKCDEFAANNPMQWKSLCISILEYCVLLPIECPTQETALRIFSTLNDRGMPLEDSDIFKALIYKSHRTPENRAEFVEDWQDFSSVCEKAGINTDDIFRMYMHILRAEKGDTTSEIGLRKFFALKEYTHVFQQNAIVQILNIIAEFWLYIYKNIKSDTVTFTLTDASRKWINCFLYYPNDYWRYPISVFYYFNRESETFSDDIELFLKKLLASLLVKFILTPTVNAIKPEVFKLNAAIYKHENYKFDMVINDDEILNQLYSSAKITKSLLCLHAYLNPNQTELLPAAFEIEHIFPRKWQDTNYNGWSKADAAKYLELYGNKVAFEKKLNIQAGNGYFGQKKKRYSESKIANVRDLISHKNNDWTKCDIEERELEFSIKIMDFFKAHLI